MMHSVARGCAVVTLLGMWFHGSADAQGFGSICGAGVHETGQGTVWLPQDAIFCPLVADPKEPNSFISLLRGEFRTIGEPGGDETDIGAIGLGDSFGVLRFAGREPGNGLQLDLAGSVFAQFDLAASSFDLINADYVIGVPVSVRADGFTTRIRLYHQSSHLGDEYLLRDDDIERENLSFESLELVLSQEMGPLRAYAGGETLFRREPDELGRWLAHGGLELRVGTPGGLRLIAAADVKASEEHDWSPALSGRAGLELARSGAAGHPARLVSLLLEAYQGPSPYGQFFQDDISYFGIGIHFAL
jgi:hypothetical protein